ncbi:hypothetical protein C8R44DRAFT_855388 [Mycena epipterygia]|nr:hypothetical protein C8R44DRAFT_855388 [Mycena epipterygia]
MARGKVLLWSHHAAYISHVIARKSFLRFHGIKQTTDADHPVLQTLIEARGQPLAEGRTQLKTEILVLKESNLDGTRIKLVMHPSEVNIIKTVEYKLPPPR